MIIKQKFGYLRKKSHIYVKHLDPTQQFAAFERLYKFELEPYFKKQISDSRIYGIRNNEEKWYYNSLYAFNLKFKKFLEIATIIKNLKCSINDYFKKERNILLSRSDFFKFKNKLIRMCDTYVVNFSKYLNKTTKPKNIKYVYIESQRSLICDFCFKKLENQEYFDYSYIWLEIRKNIDKPTLNGLIN